jgi:hypothetical protein
MIPLVIVVTVAGLSAALTYAFSPARALVLVYLPVVLLLSQVPKIDIPFLPDPDAKFACMYGVLAALAATGFRGIRFKWHVCDTIMIVLSSLAVLTAVTTEVWWTGVSAAGDQALGLLLPYFLARSVFADAAARRDAVIVLSICAMFVGLIALIEMRLFPYAYSRFLEPLGVVKTSNGQVFWRFGYMRAQTTFAHPIDLGNVGPLLAALIGVMAVTTGTRLKHPIVMGGLISCGLMVMGALSFTSFLSAAAAMGVFALIWYWPGVRRLFVPGVITAVVAAAIFTKVLLGFDLQNWVVEPNSLDASLRTRALIVQNTWNLAKDSGLLGYGKTVGQSDLDLLSVDNSYMLMLLRQGWLGLATFLTLVAVLSWRANQSLAFARTPNERLPVAIAYAGIVGTLIAMYTVWFGFAYRDLLILLIGILVWMCDLLASRAAGVPMVTAQSAGSRIAGRGFPVVRQPSMGPAGSMGSFAGRM